MATSVLTEFLRIGLIQGIDDPDHDRLIKASERIRERLDNNHTVMRRYCVALLDERLPDNDPTLDEIQKDIEVEWKTFPGKFTTRPVALLRAVGFQALVDTVGEESSPINRIFWLTGSSLIERMSLGAERDLLRSQFIKWGEASEEEAEQEWQNAETFSGTLNIKFDKLATKTIDAKAFTIPEGTALTPETAAPIVDNVSQGLVALFNQNSAAVGKALETALNSGLAKIAESQRRRLALLWWKQTLYSPSYRQGYRAIQSPSVRIFALAFDLNKQLPGIYPQSVEYLLRETVSDISDSWHSSVSVFSNALISDPTFATLLQPLCSPQIGRVPLLTYLSAAARGEVKDTDAARIVGLPDQVELDGADFAVWLLRELSAHTLATRS